MWHICLQYIQKPYLTISRGFKTFSKLFRVCSIDPLSCQPECHIACIIQTYGWYQSNIDTLGYEQFECILFCATLYCYHVEGSPSYIYSIESESGSCFELCNRRKLLRTIFSFKCNANSRILEKWLQMEPYSLMRRSFCHLCGEAAAIYVEEQLPLMWSSRCHLFGRAAATCVAEQLPLM